MSDPDIAGGLDQLALLAQSGQHHLVNDKLATLLEGIASGDELEAIESHANAVAAALEAMNFKKRAREAREQVERRKSVLADDQRARDALAENRAMQAKIQAQIDRAVESLRLAVDGYHEDEPVRVCTAVRGQIGRISALVGENPPPQVTAAIRDLAAKILATPLAAEPSCDDQIQWVLSQALKAGIDPGREADESFAMARLVMDGHADDWAPETQPAAGSLCGLALAVRRYVQAKQDQPLSGRIRFDEMTRFDVELAAGYCAALLKQHGKHIETQLESSSWPAWPGVRDVLAKDVDLNSFKLYGAQPRLAEMAFERVLRSVYQVANPIDLNRLDRFHPQDWRDPDSGQEYDVKSNTLRSGHVNRAGRTGMRGFMVNTASEAPPGTDAAPLLAGIVFHKRSDDEMQWSFVGTAKEVGLFEKLYGKTRPAGRVRPFMFGLPNAFPLEEHTDQVDALRELLVAAQRRGTEGAALEPDDRLLGAMDPEPVLRSLEIWQPPDEGGIDERTWRALTEGAFQRLAAGEEPAQVMRWADHEVHVLTSPWLLHRPIEVGGNPLLLAWHDEVLKVLITQMGPNRCPFGQCSPECRLELQSLSAAGTLLAQTTACLQDVTVLTHCHNRDCADRILVFGRQDTCSACGGLICDNRTRSGADDGYCGQCKAPCRRTRSNPAAAEPRWEFDM